MEDCCVKSDENEKILIIDANNLYGHSMSQHSPQDEIEKWYGHPDLHVNKLEEKLNTSHDSGIEYFVEVDSRYPDNLKEKREFSILSRE